MTDEPGRWFALRASQFVDRRSQFRQGRTQILHVRAFHGVIVRRGEDGKREHEICPHAHQKAKAANRCAEAAARRKNRE